MKLLQVLDHGYIRLVDSMGSDLSIVRSARVTYDADWRTGENSGRDEKLLKYLITHGHTSPLESVVFTFEVKAPIFVFRQWHRHRTWSFNEISARYSELPEEYYVPEEDMISIQDPDNKQARQMGGNNLNKKLIVAHIQGCNDAAFNDYRQLLEWGCPRELARTVLPVGTYSRMFATVNLNNLFKFINERLSDGAQYEIKVYAKAILELIEHIVPVSTRIMREKNGWVDS